MLKNYFVSAYRNLLRSRLDTFLNISGLVIGLSAALLITLFVRYESSYDEFWSDADRIHRIQTRWVLEGRDDIDVVNTTGRLKALLENYYANELEAVVITILVLGIEGWYNGHRLRAHSFHFHPCASVGASRGPHQDGGLQVKIPAGQV